jgi:plasmid stability protein
MASLVVRKLDDDLVPLLKERAKRNGRSTEEEHREILRAALRPASTGEELIRRLRTPISEGADLDWWTGVDDTMRPAELD